MQKNKLNSNKNPVKNSTKVVNKNFHMESHSVNHHPMQVNRPILHPSQQDGPIIYLPIPEE